MEIVNRVSAFQNYQSLPDVIAEWPKSASENSEPISEYIKLRDVFRLWRHDDHAEWRKEVSSSIRSLHSLACFIQSCDDSHSKIEKKRKRNFEMLLDRLNI